MMTKKELCLAIIEHQCQLNGIPVGPVPETSITLSSALAVAMEHLGLLKTKDMQDYATTRGGTLLTEYFLFYNGEKRNAVSLSVRELLELLPE